MIGAQLCYTRLGWLNCMKFRTRHWILYSWPFRFWYLTILGGFSFAYDSGINDRRRHRRRQHFNFPDAWFMTLFMHASRLAFLRSIFLLTRHVLHLMGISQMVTMNVFWDFINFNWLYPLSSSWLKVLNYKIIMYNFKLILRFVINLFTQTLTMRIIVTEPDLKSIPKFINTYHAMGEGYIIFVVLFVIHQSND